MIVEAGSFDTHIFSQVPHGCRPKTLFPEELGGFLDDGIFFTTVLFAPDFCHFRRKDRQLGSVGSAHRNAYLCCRQNPVGLQRFAGDTGYFFIYFILCHLSVLEVWLMMPLKRLLGKEKKSWAGRRFMLLMRPRIS